MKTRAALLGAVLAALCGTSVAHAQPRRRPPPRNGPRRNPPRPTPPRVVESTGPAAPMDFVTTPIEPEPEPAPTPSPPESARPVAIDLSAGMRVFNRSFRWEGDTARALRPYTLTVAPALAVAGVWYPGAHFTAGALAHVGLAASADLAFGIASQDAAGREFETSALAWSVGLRGRIPLGSFTLTLHADVLSQLYYVAVPTATDDLGVPEAIYRSAALGLDVNVAVSANISVRAGVRYLAVLSAGTIGDTVFPNATTDGVDAEIGLSIGLGAGFDLRFAGGFRRYFFTLNAVPTDRFAATGATDDYFSALAALGFRR